MKKISLNLITIGNLPSSYTLSMSYEEQLLWLLNKMEKEVIPDLNNLIKYVDNLDLNFEEIDKEIENINININSLNTLYENLNQQTSQNTQDIINLNNLINSQINQLRNELIQLINENYQVLKDYVDMKDHNLQQQIDNINIGNLQIYDPTTGAILPLQQVINNLYGATNVNGLTATEFDGLDLTATNFDAYEITAKEFDSDGKNILV